MSVGTVWYVGAGPGDPELISVRGERLLREAQVVIHDANIAPELLDQCQSGARIIEAKASPRATAQELQGIAHQVIAAANAGYTVVRLKVGDPLLFSRALEEIAAVGSAGLQVRVIPGVAAPLGASAFAGIPLTPASGSGAVTFISALHTGTEAAVREMLHRQAKTADSMCVFCSRPQLPHVVQTLLQTPRFASAASAVVSRASQPEQVTIEAPLDRLLQACTESTFDEPFLLFVGGDTGWRQQLAWFEQLPLHGRRLLLCRAKHQAQQSARSIRDQGAQPILLPLIAIEPPSDVAPFNQCIAQLANYDWVVLTSANGAEQLMQGISAQGLDARAFGQARLAVIGPGTAKPLRKWGIVPNLLAKEHVAEGLASELLQVGNIQSVLLVRAEQARDTLPETLRQAGVRVDVVAAYRTRKLGNEQSSRLRSMLECNELDAVLLTSSSMADALVSALGPNAAALLSRAVVASIGPITTTTLRQLGVTVDVTADEYTVEGLLVALGRYFENPRIREVATARC